MGFILLIARLDKSSIVNTECLKKVVVDILELS